MNLTPAPYYNNPQLAVKFSTAAHKMLPWGRGTGKTTILADEIVKFIFGMPRCKGGFCGLTYVHVRTRSMPAIIDQWERLGLFRHIHYFIGHKAPKKYGWDEPFAPPLDYSNAIHFFNGSVVEFISFDRPEMARSGSYDFLLFDEASKLKRTAVFSDVMPANRGNKFRFGHIRFHHATMFCTTMPLTPEGEWIFEYEEMMKEDAKHYLYLEASAKENQAILGERYFRDLKRELPDIIYQVEIENKRIKFNENGFYPKLTEEHLYYNSYNYSFYESIAYDVSKLGALDSRGDADCNTNLSLDISWDFGSRINCCVVCQHHADANEYRVINNFYLENEAYQPVVKLFLDYYKYHSNKTIYLYGGSDGTKKVANSTMTYIEEVIQLLHKGGWTVYNMAQTHEILHMDKYRFYIRFLTKDIPAFPFFLINQNNAMETYVSMCNAPILLHEIKKDKSSERDEDLPQWRATHLSDALDNLLYWKFYSALDDNQPTYDIVINK